LLVDHKLSEVFSVADDIVAMADGHIVLERSRSNVDRAEVVAAIVGESAASVVEQRAIPGGDSVSRRAGSMDPAVAGGVSASPGAVVQGYVFGMRGRLACTHQSFGSAWTYCGTVRSDGFWEIAYDARPGGGGTPDVGCDGTGRRSLQPS